MNLPVPSPLSSEDESRAAAEGRDEELLASARRTLLLAARALERAASGLDSSFCEAVELISGCSSRVVVSGMGKSGHVARKLATTLASSGTPAFFLHPGEAAHGDLGMVTEDDVVVLVSRSGETSELCRLLAHFRELRVPIVAIVGTPGSTVARAAEVVLDASVEREACPFGRVPTTSALTAMALGDALTIAVMTRRAVRPEDVARVHPSSPRSGFPSREQPAASTGSGPVRMLSRAVRGA